MKLKSYPNLAFFDFNAVGIGQYIIPETSGKKFITVGLRHVSVAQWNPLVSVMGLRSLGGISNLE